MPDALGRTVNVDARRLAAIMFTDIVGFSRQMIAASLLIADPINDTRLIVRN
jgi:class 3 adenylate cyclase